MKRSRVAFMVILVGGASVGFGCGGGSSPVTVNKIVPKSASQQQNVMVIDEGIDLSASDLQGRVAAAYTETCADDSSDAGLAGPGVPSTAARRSTPSSRCSSRPCRTLTTAAT